MLFFKENLKSFIKFCDRAFFNHQLSRVRAKWFPPGSNVNGPTSKNIQLNYEECAKLPFVLKSKPVLIYAEISTKCNLQCRMCGRAHYHIPQEEQGFMKKETFEKLSKLFTCNAQLALFGRGETLLHPDFVHFLKIARNAGLRIGFNTNGLALTKTIAKAMVENAQTHITFSCSAGSPETYKKIHGTDAWEKLWSNIDLLNAMKLEYGAPRNNLDIMQIPPAVYLEFVAQLANISELPALVRKAFEHNIQGMMVIDVVAHSKEMEKERMNLPETIPIAQKYYEEALGVQAELIKSKIKNFDLRLPSSYSSITKKFTSQHEKDMLSGITQHLNNGLMKGENNCFCLEPWQTFYVRFDGTVATCVITNRIFGDLNKSKAKEVWNGEVFQKFRQRMRGANKPYECLRCHLFPGPKIYDKGLNDPDDYEPL